MIKQGKLGHFGVSNFRGWRTAEAEQIPAANHFGLGVVTYSPLARGVLTGKDQPDVKPDADSRVGPSNKRVLETEWRPESLVVAQRIQEHLSAGLYTRVIRLKAERLVNPPSFT